MTEELKYTPRTAPPLAKQPPLLLRLLRGILGRIPPLPHASAIGNRLAKPLWNRIERARYVLPVWEGLLMELCPTEALGGFLTFTPQLYDRWERRAIRELLPHDGVFVDVGANIGAYTLWAAHCLRGSGRVMAIEADPNNFVQLVRNLRLNDLANVTPLEAGVSDRQENLLLHLNCTGNAGGHTFLEGVHPGGRTVPVACDRLSVLLRGAGVQRSDFFKLDIEGFELRVLAAFFRDEPPDSPLRPRFLLTEFFSGQDSTLLTMLTAAGYQLRQRHGLNGLFECTNR